MRKILFPALLTFVCMLSGCVYQTKPIQNITSQETENIKNVIYTNVEYGFALSFPETWKDYTVQKRTLDWGGLGTSDSVDLGLLAQEEILNISIHTKEQWQQIQSEEGPKPEYLGENELYVFGYSSSQYAADEKMKERRKEIDSIIKTFELKG